MAAVVGADWARADGATSAVIRDSAAFAKADGATEAVIKERATRFMGYLMGAETTLEHTSGSRTAFLPIHEAGQA